MRYAFLAYDAHSSLDHLTAQERARWEAEDAEVFAELTQNGYVVSGVGLHGVDTATTVRVRDGQVVVTDGPFAETTEALGGVLVIDVPDLDTALHYAARLPAARSGTLEVRPVHHG